ncbi:hypothetical protein OTK49_21000 [Vibrio coralliirubri]|uniref:hypothetical protein n=1 Tax=Vibrio coralliirubri TaxID=1516159 RepID=UPI002284D24D|nr:hypothetical protein [Vibrio coralliirubri]MCY9864998.1 hypothetical protein [Vibrio coralliirubri]
MIIEINLYLLATFSTLIGLALVAFVDVNLPPHYEATPKERLNWFLKGSLGYPYFIGCAALSLFYGALATGKEIISFALNPMDYIFKVINVDNVIDLYLFHATSKTH